MKELSCATWVTLLVKQVNGVSIDVSALSSGSYIVKAANGTTLGTTTFIKK